MSLTLEELTFWARAFGVAEPEQKARDALAAKALFDSADFLAGLNAGRDHVQDVNTRLRAQVRELEAGLRHFYALGYSYQNEQDMRAAGLSESVINICAPIRQALVDKRDAKEAK